MSENNNPQLDAACRILIVSSSIAGAKVFINRLKALSNDGDGESNVKTSDENIVPWTIVNRYYTANVHFLAHVIHGLSPLVFDKPHMPPAVIYVWVEGESYAKHVEELSRMMGGYEPEVSLAVRIPKSDETAGLVEDNSETQRENNTDIDTILISYGFEYIDATGDVPLRRTGDDGSELLPTDGLHTFNPCRSLRNFLNLLCSTLDIPHLPRVLDALSTIMWPSMKSVHKGSAGSGESGALMVSTEESFTTNTVHPQLPWLTLNSGKIEDSIFSPIDNVSMSLSPNDMEATSPFGMEKALAAKPTSKVSIGFEDDFTVFVSAPALNYQEGETTPDALSYHMQQDSDTFDSPMPSAIASSTLDPGSARVRYRSLRSVSDFGGSDFGDEEPMYKTLDDGDDEVDYDDDNDLPTREEIRETSAKIFGTVPSQKKGEGATATVVEAESLPGVTQEGLDGNAPFDLSQVMSALQQFKTDISGMDNEEERRKAAAKVALGLVYGLEGID
ncbi:hypothetical protein BYT27DRAFT_6887396 [Phlegmacium glaucopus]|nr:hypothetical protein BYT27DRAFT_6887396 [Phlegmacium glaucopus]